MGQALAQAAVDAGHQVTVVSGPVEITYPPHCEVIPVVSTEDMLSTCQRMFPQCDGLIGVAAPCDYRPVKVEEQKIKKTGAEITLRLEQNPDILATLARKKGNRLVVGFAAETDKVAENARKKLRDKDADLIVANDVTAEGAGFDVDTNVVTLFARDGRDLALPKLTKREVAHRILDEVVRLAASLKHQSAG